MATLWEQPDDSDLELEPVSIPDTKAGDQVKVSLNSDESDRPSKFYGVLDGRQRCTALAMVFGGLRASSGLRRFNGGWFLDVKDVDITARVAYFSNKDITSKGLTSTASCVAAGLFPLATTHKDGLLAQWMNYLQALTDPTNYPGGELPSTDELARRNDVLQSAFTGINSTVLAVYIVPADYSLGEICEIFETLNTTGTRVSTVDLLHSWLYADTVDDLDPVQLRDWIDDLGSLDGAAGWASRNKRPELIAQTVTACYLGLDSAKPEPRKVGRRAKAPVITSVKAGDLLATPTAFWKEAIARRDALASYIGGYQDAVCGGRFDLQDCPYPVTMAIYASLRWYMDIDPRHSGQWTIDDLDALFRAFFWRTALTSRYDQGFLTQSAADLRWLKDILFERKGRNANEWATWATQQLNLHIQGAPTSEDVKERLMHSRAPGAMGKALALPVLTRPTVDLLNPGDSITYPSQAKVELHHVYPRAWCANNKHGSLSDVLEPSTAGYDYVRSIANMTPLTSKSNSEWRAKTPGQALVTAGITFDNARERLLSHFIDKVAFDALTGLSPNPGAFWNRRAQLIAEDLTQRCVVSY